MANACRYQPLVAWRSSRTASTQDNLLNPSRENGALPDEPRLSRSEDVIERKCPGLAAMGSVVGSHHHYSLDRGEGSGRGSVSPGSDVAQADGPCFRAVRAPGLQAGEPVVGAEEQGFSHGGQKCPRFSEPGRLLFLAATLLAAPLPSSPQSRSYGLIDLIDLPQD